MQSCRQQQEPTEATQGWRNAAPERRRNPRPSGRGGCQEVVLNREHGDRYSELIGAFQRQVNAAFVDPSYIARVRRKLDLDQRQAAELFGGGVNAFSRYENGKTKPPLALVKLLKLLDRHPDLLDELRAI